MNPSSPSHRPPIFSEIDALGLLALAGLSVLFYFLVLLPMLTGQKTLAAEQQELQVQKNKAAAVAADLQAANTRLASQRKLIADNPMKLESIGELNNRLARITALATVGGLDIADLRPAAPVNGTQYTTVPMELTGAGGFANCVRYLHELHEQLPDTSCTSVKLTGTPESPAAAHFEFELSWHAAGQSIAATPTEEN
jgi:Tfp pilus assembly protein PilO